jgi:hypothetical protein
MVVQLMETGVIGVAVHSPRCQNKQVAGSASIETALRRFPIAGDRFLLKEYQRERSIKGCTRYKALAFGNAWGNKDRSFFGHP